MGAARVTPSARRATTARGIGRTAPATPVRAIPRRRPTTDRGTATAAHGAATPPATQPEATPTAAAPSATARATIRAPRTARIPWPPARRIHPRWASPARRPLGDRDHTLARDPCPAGGLRIDADLGLQIAERVAQLRKRDHLHVLADRGRVGGN